MGNPYLPIARLLKGSIFLFGVRGVGESTWRSGTLPTSQAASPREDLVAKPNDLVHENWRPHAKPGALFRLEGQI
jgi:hypothetical protein